jgi:hypothetical protein
VNGDSNRPANLTAVLSKTLTTVSNQTQTQAQAQAQATDPTRTPTSTPAPVRTEVPHRSGATSLPPQSEYKTRTGKPAFKREGRPTVHKHITAPGHDMVRKHTVVDKKPVSPSMDDLRSVLTQISQSSQTDSKSTYPDRTAPTTPGSNGLAGPATFKKIASTITPLQEALAELKKVDIQKTPRVLPPRPFPLPTSFTPASVIIKTEAENLQSEIESVFASLDKKVPAKQSEQSEESVISTTPVSLPTPELSVAPTKVNTSEANSLSSKQIAKILQGGAKERSPFR